MRNLNKDTLLRETMYLFMYNFRSTDLAAQHLPQKYRDGSLPASQKTGDRTRTKPDGFFNEYLKKGEFCQGLLLFIYSTLQKQRSTKSSG